MPSHGLIGRALSPLTERATHQPPTRASVFKHSYGEENETQVGLEEPVSLQQKEGKISLRFTNGESETLRGQKSLPRGLEEKAESPLAPNRRISPAFHPRASHQPWAAARALPGERGTLGTWGDTHPFTRQQETGTDVSLGAISISRTSPLLITVVTNKELYARGKRSI